MDLPLSDLVAEIKKKKKEKIIYLFGCVGS